METMHKQTSVILKTADIDVGIVPVVQWLNGIEGVFTCYSCEGKNEEFPPTIEFVYSTIHALDAVAVKFRSQHCVVQIIDARHVRITFYHSLALETFIGEQLCDV